MAHLAHYREAHPLPLVITHYVNLSCMALLILTGFMIHFPYAPANMGICRGVHIFCGIVLLINCIVRIVLAFVVESAPAEGTRQMQKDIRSWIPQPDNRHQLIEWVKFYLFIKKDHPLSGKFNPLQKIAYGAIPFLIILMAYTGFCLWVPTSSLPLFQAGTDLVGGIMSMRIIHYIMMFVFILFTMIHVYMSVIEGGKHLLALMFARKQHGGMTYDIHTHDVAGEDYNVR
ncbi:cytochrome b/b6 domain-containing protein [Cryptobacterium curtum]|uniref:cytochrome b/b6 domain-containing protein n=1 Tax=Cryptobacterium curtum TaxID=84163 RepID=UPI00248E8D93|nr:cytochrome b/b6 domain-containing protein [Cryptobacterium curtum]